MNMRDAHTDSWVAGVCLLFALGTADQRTLAQAPAEPVAPVAIAFFAVTSDGRPVPDLNADAVRLKVDGRPRVVRSLEWVPIATAADCVR